MYRLTPEILNSFGYFTKESVKTTDKLTKVFFSKDRESYLVIINNYIVANKFVNDRPQEKYRGHIESEEQLKEIINQLK